VVGNQALIPIAILSALGGLMALVLLPAHPVIADDSEEFDQEPILAVSLEA
jgi:hypothetical protein